MDRMSDGTHPRGLTSAEAAQRLNRLGLPEPAPSRSVASIIAGNVFTLFNAILGTFFVIMLALGLFADALFGVIAIINSGIGIRQDVKAKEPLDKLALLVAPKANVIRDGAFVEVTGDRVVPVPIVGVHPPDPAGRRGVLIS